MWEKKLDKGTLYGFTWWILSAKSYLSSKRVMVRVFYCLHSQVRDILIDLQLPKPWTDFGCLT